MDNYSIHPEQHTNPLNAGITGLAYSIAQSNHQILLRNIDLSTEDIQDLQAHRNLLALITDEPPSDRGEVVKIKSGKRYREKFFKLALDTMNLSGIRKQGVYLIVGGSGVVGQIMTCNLAEKYQANIIWIGRSPEDSPKIQDALKSFNKKLFYVQADVTSLDSMRQAIMRIKKKHANIHGAIFSGLIFDFENSIEQTTESEFKQILEIKTKGSLIFTLLLKKSHWISCVIFLPRRRILFRVLQNFLLMQRVLHSQMDLSAHCKETLYSLLVRLIGVTGSLQLKM